jgi:hypothetical protein
MTPADAAVLLAALVIMQAPELARIIAANAKDKRAAKLKAGAK